MKRLLAFGVCMVLSSQVFAARIVSDVYPLTGPFPDECGYTEGAAPLLMFAVEVVSGGVRCNITVTTVASGSHTFLVLARSAQWGDSTKIPFTFTAGAPATPGGLRVIP